MRRSARLVTGGLIILLLPLTVWAQSSSSSYRLWGQAVTGGGDFSTSTNYRMYQSAADLSSQAANSTNYHLGVGFQALYEEPKITMSVSSNTITLSPSHLSTGSVSTGAVTVTVATNADFGYALTATALTGFQNFTGHVLTAVSDGSVTAGSEEFGIAVSGTDAAFGDDRSVSSTPRTIASRSIWTTGVTTTVTVKAAISSTTNEGVYNGTIGFIATGTY